MTSEDEICLDARLCRDCAGRCCKGSPGIWVDPERFFSTFFAGQRLTLERLRERLPALNVVLWEKTGVPIPAPLSLVSGCAFLEDDGCRLTVAQRPCQCLAMIPNPETLLQTQGCFCLVPQAFNRDAAKQRWRDYWQSVS